MYDWSPPTIIDMLHSPRVGATIPDILSLHTIILHELKENLQRTCQRMCDQANRHCVDNNFKPDDWVWVRLQPYRQDSMEHRSNQKLGPLFSGPYLILRRIIVVVYELQLPLMVRVHPVFHVSLFHPFKGSHDVFELPATKKPNSLSLQTHNLTQHLIPNYLNASQEGANTNTPRHPRSECANF